MRRELQTPPHDHRPPPRFAIGALNQALRIIDLRVRILGLDRPPTPYKDPQKMTSLREIEAAMRALIDDMARRTFWAGEG